MRETKNIRGKKLLPNFVPNKREHLLPFKLKGEIKNGTFFFLLKKIKKEITTFLGRKINLTIFFFFTTPISCLRKTSFKKIITSH